MLFPRFYIEGTLSFLKGCQEFSITSTDKDDKKFQFSQSAEAPIAYTKLSCFLPWVAKQFGLSYDAGLGTDDACVTGWGERPAIYAGRYDTTCREAVGQIGDPYKRPCIFPFYVDDKLYTECGLFGEPSFIVPVWRCPVYNITRKKDGINHFLKEEIEDAHGLCLSDSQQPSLLNQTFQDLFELYNATYTLNSTGGQDEVFNAIKESTEKLNTFFEKDTPVIDLLLGRTEELDPGRTKCDFYSKHRPFSTCKNDCPGGKCNQLSGREANTDQSGLLLHECVCSSLSFVICRLSFHSERNWNNLWGSHSLRCRGPCWSSHPTPSCRFSI